MKSSPSGILFLSEKEKRREESCRRAEQEIQQAREERDTARRRVGGRILPGRPARFSQDLRAADAASGKEIIAKYEYCLLEILGIR